jgi:hypothetical protein
MDLPLPGAASRSLGQIWHNDFVLRLMVAMGFVAARLATHIAIFSL